MVTKKYLSSVISMLLNCVYIIRILLVFIVSLQKTLKSSCFGKIHSVKPREHISVNPTSGNQCYKLQQLERKQISTDGGTLPAPCEMETRSLTRERGSLHIMRDIWSE